MRILGLDIGTTSVGFALIDQPENPHDQPEKPHGAQIIRISVRIFPEGRNEKERTPRIKTAGTPACSAVRCAVADAANGGLAIF